MRLFFTNIRYLILTFLDKYFPQQIFFCKIQNNQISHSACGERAENSIRWKPHLREIRYLEGFLPVAAIYKWHHRRHRFYDEETNGNWSANLILSYWARGLYPRVDSRCSGSVCANTHDGREKRYCDTGEFLFLFFLFCPPTDAIDCATRHSESRSYVRAYRTV